jgi:hypothetical protein
MDYGISRSVVLGSQPLEKIIQSNMKLALKLALLAILSFASSCALIANDKNSKVTINSTPPGADVFIDGRNYGRTPITLNLEAKNQTAVLSKQGYGSAQLQLEVWYSAKNGACLADGMGLMFIAPIFSFTSGKCSEFKEKEYFVNIPNSGRASGRFSSVVGASDSKDMVDYYYNQNQAPKQSSQY